MMKDYEPAMSFGEQIAQGYHDFQRGDEAAAVAFLAQQAGPGPALELGIGAGRLALPLTEQNVLCNLRTGGPRICPKYLNYSRIFFVNHINLNEIRTKSIYIRTIYYFWRYN